MHLIGDRVFGILGLGLIGSATARKAAGLGYQVICHDIAAGEASEFRGYPHVSLDELLRRSQVLSIHTPLTDLTRHIIDAEALAAMRPDAILVNTARGPIVDTAALGEALRTGQIRGAALDVTEPSPCPRTTRCSPFRSSRSPPTWPGTPRRATGNSSGAPSRTPPTWPRAASRATSSTRRCSALPGATTS
jgi:phosphoglycerate dehydrogenase-like enzyme